MGKSIVAALLALSLAAPSAATAQEDTTVVDVPDEHHGLMLYYMRAAGIEGEDRFAAAQQAYREGLTVFPDSPHLQLGAARTSAAAGDDEACLQALTHLAALGAKTDLAAMEVLEPYLGRQEFQNLAAVLHPGDPPSVAGAVHALQDDDHVALKLRWTFRM